MILNQMFVHDQKKFYECIQKHNVCIFNFHKTIFLLDSVNVVSVNVVSIVVSIVLSEFSKWVSDEVESGFVESMF